MNHWIALHRVAALWLLPLGWSIVTDEVFERDSRRRHFPTSEMENNEKFWNVYFKRWDGFPQAFFSEESLEIKKKNSR